MQIDCSKCGRYEIGPKLYEELMPLSENSWQIDRLVDGILKVPEPRMIRKQITNIAEVEPYGADKPTKLRKRFLRARAEGKTVTGPTIFYSGSADDETST